MNKEDIVKYETKNPVSRALLAGFSNALRSMAGSLDGVTAVLEAGCGNGYITAVLAEYFKNMTAFDIDETKVAQAKAKGIDGAVFGVNSIYESGYADGSFDLVVSTEVFEHLENPAAALAEVARISKKYILLSVPNEPLWSFMNMVRFKYLSSFGNTPGHINRWSVKSFPRFLRAGGVDGIKTAAPGPWAMFLCTPAILTEAAGGGGATPQHVVVLFMPFFCESEAAA